MSRGSVLRNEFMGTLALSGSPTTIFSAQALSNGNPITITQNPAADSRICFYVGAGSDTTGSITFTGELDSAAQSEAITISGIGWYFTTKFFDALSQCSTTNVNLTSLSAYTDGYVNSKFLMRDVKVNDAISPSEDRIVYFVASPPKRLTGAHGGKAYKYPIRIKIAFSESEILTSLTTMENISQDVQDQVHPDDFTTDFVTSVTNGLKNYEMSSEPSFVEDDLNVSRYLIFLDYDFYFFL